MTDKLSEVYLGDGLYASFDGYQFVLRAPRENGDHWVALEPAVMEMFIRFAQDQTAKKLAEKARLT